MSAAVEATDPNIQTAATAGSVAASESDPDAGRRIGRLTCYQIFVLRICEKCQDMDNVDDLHCDQCGQRWHRFYGEHSEDEFCKWLFFNKVPASYT